MFVRKSRRVSAATTRKAILRRSLVGAIVLALWGGGTFPAQAQTPPDGTPVTVTGTLHVVHGDDFDHNRAHFYYHVEDAHSKKLHRLHFTGPLPKHLHSGTTVTVHGKTRGSHEIVLEANGDTSFTTVAPATAAAVSGDQRTLVLVANFQDANVACSVSTIQQTMFTDTNNKSVDDLYRENSFGQLSFSGDVQGAYTIPYATTSPCDYYAWANAAEAAAQSSGIDVSSYPRRVYVLPSTNSCGYSGLGTVGGSPSKAWIFRCDLKDIFAHEVGHNISAGHAATPTAEYGDTSDIMGYSGIGLRHMNAPHKAAMGWLPTGQVQTVTTDGTYRIAPLAVNPADTIAPQALKITKPDTGEYYYISYRTPVGFDASLSSTYSNRVNVHRYVGAGSSLTYFLQGLADGGSFTDSINGITVTQVSHDATTATVQVSFVCTAAAPVVSLSPANQSGAPGNVKQYTLSVKNADSAACGQSTFNLSASVPAGWTGTMTPTGLSLAPGATGSATLAVASTTSTTSGTYAVSSTALDTSRAVHTASAKGTYVVDATAPTAPSSLTAVLKGKQVQLAWKASSDNVAVTSYIVYRNNVRLTTVTGTSYTDSSTRTGQSYTYTVVATDAAGNVSAASNAVTMKR